MIICYSATGNSLFVARRLAEATGEKLVDVTALTGADTSEVFLGEERYVFCAPIHAASPAPSLVSLIERSHVNAGAEAYFVLTSAGSMWGAPGFARRIAAEKGLVYQGCTSIIMPQNYVVLVDTWDDERARAAIEAALPAIDEIAERILSHRALDEPSGGPMEYRIASVTLPVFQATFMRDGLFRATEACVGCGRCTELCPMRNITLEDGRPRWHGSCTHCMACINRCPTEAIEYGPFTRGRRRYKGPDALMQGA